MNGWDAFAQELGNYGQTTQNLAKTIFSVEADRVYQNEAQNIANEIEAFNTELTTDPDHGNPVATEPEGYMKKWQDKQKAINERIAKVTNPLAKKNLEAYFGKVTVEEHSSVFGAQYKGWKNQYVTDTKTRIEETISKPGLTIQDKLSVIANEMAGIKKYGLLGADEYDVIEKGYIQKALGDELVKKVVQTAKDKGTMAATTLLIGEGLQSYTYNGKTVAVSSTDIDRAFSLLKIQGASTEVSVEQNISDLFASVDEKIRLGTANEDDVDAMDTYMKDPKVREALGTNYATWNDRKGTLSWKITTRSSESKRADLEKKIRTDPGSVTRDELWGAGLTAEDSSYLENLKLSTQAKEKDTAEDAAMRTVITRYAVNQKMERGEPLAEGESPLTQKELATIPNLPPSVLQAYTNQLNADKSSTAALSAYWEYQGMVDQGKSTSEIIAALKGDKRVDLSTVTAVMNLSKNETGNSEYKNVRLGALNLVKQINGEELPEGTHVLSYADLATIKDPTAYDAATTALAAASNTMKAKGKSEKYIATFTRISKGEIKDGDAILSDTALEPDDRHDLYIYWQSNHKDVAEGELEKSYQLAIRTASGTLKEGETGLSMEDFQASIEKSDASPAVKRMYGELANNLDATQVTAKVQAQIRDKGKAWVDAGVFNQDEYNALEKVIDSATLVDKSSLYQVLDAYKSNAEAKKRQMDYDAQTAADRAYTTGQRERQQADQAASDARKLKRNEAWAAFKEALPTMTEEEYNAAYQNMAEIYKDAPEELSTNFHPFEVMYQDKYQKDFSKQDEKASAAFNELVNSSTIAGWQKTTEPLTATMIEELFPTDSKADTDARKYWTGKLSEFQRSDEANKANHDAAYRRLVDARSNSWAAITGIGFDKSKDVLTPELIKEVSGYLKPGEYDGFSADFDTMNRTIKSQQEAADKKASGQSATPAETAAGKRGLDVLTGLSSLLAAQGETMGAPTNFQYLGADGKMHTLAATVDTFNAILQEFGPDLMVSNKWGDAVKLMEKFTTKKPNGAWKPVYDTIDNITNHGKKPLPGEIQQWIDLETAQNPADAKTINGLIEGLKKRNVNINLSKAFNFRQNSPDASEQYLESAMRGDYDLFVGYNSAGQINATAPFFSDTLQTFEKKSLDAINFVTGAKLVEGVNCKKSVQLNGLVTYQLTDKKLLTKMGFAGDSATFYLGLYGQDAVPIFELISGGTKYVRAFVPWESNPGATKSGRWVLVAAKEDPDGVIRFSKSQAQENIDAAKPPKPAGEQIGGKAMESYLPWTM